MNVIVEGGLAIAGVGLLSLTLALLFPYCKKETNKGIKKIDEMIVSSVNDFTNSKSRDNLLESICKLRRRKAHLQKDNQNFFFSFLFTSSCFIIIGIIPTLPVSIFNNFAIILKPTLGMLSFFSFGIGVCFILRLFIELNRIDKEKP